MSVPVPLEELPQAVERFGLNPYIVTVGADGRPRATSVTVKWHNSLLMIGAGRLFVQPGKAVLHATTSRPPRS